MCPVRLANTTGAPARGRWLARRPHAAWAAPLAYRPAPRIARGRRARRCRGRPGPESGTGSATGQSAISPTWGERRGARSSSRSASSCSCWRAHRTPGAASSRTSSSPARLWCRSGRQDLNLRPPGPSQSVAVAVRRIPCVHAGSAWLSCPARICSAGKETAAADSMLRSTPRPAGSMRLERGQTVTSLGARPWTPGRHLFLPARCLPRRKQRSARESGDRTRGIIGRHQVNLGDVVAELRALRDPCRPIRTSL
jgi:hypothetical protein